MKMKLILLAVVALAIAAFFYFGLNQYLTLESFKARQADFAESYAANPLIFLGGFFCVYVAATALSLPGAAILTIAAGALFGLITGTILVSFASSIGATLAFVSSRFLFRDWVEGKFGDKLKGINEGLERDGAFYLFTIRMIPAFPFFVVNLLMGLTKIRVRTYYWVSQLGMLIATIVFVNAGTQLANLQPGQSLLSPALIGSFVALAIFPWIAKGLIAATKRRRVYRGWKRPRKFDANLIVIGAGSAGLVSAYIAATVKAKVTLIEAADMGGDCLNTGCVPSKALIKSAHIAHLVSDARRFGINAGAPKVDFPAVMQRVHDVIAAIEPHDSVERFTGLGVDCVQGYARFIDPWTVEITHEVKTRRMTAKAFVVATGAAPFIPPLPGIDTSGYLTSETLWNAMLKRKEVPKRLIIMGGGPIGCELAQSFQRLGSQVTLVEMADRVMLKEDASAAAIVDKQLRSEGVRILSGHKAVRIDEAGNLIVQGEGAELSIPYDDLIVAVGRRARISGFGLEELGLVMDGRVAVDAYLATNMPHIMVAGDVAGNQQFTHGASHEAWYASVNALAAPFRKYRADYRVLPRVTYTSPEVASVGINQDEATQKAVSFDVTHYDLDDLDRAITEGETKGFVKILTAKGSDKILGATVVGAHAGETIAELVFAMKHNMGLGKIMQVVHSYPTWAESNKYAAGQFRLIRKPEGLLRIAQKWFDWMRG